MNVSLWFEGSHHPFDATAAWFGDALADAGLRPVRRSLDAALSEPADLVVLGGLVYSGTPGYATPLRLLERLRAVHAPILALHSVIGSWDDLPELDGFWDGRWVWGHSDHSPVEPFQVRSAADDPPSALRPPPFTTTDELYYNLRPPRECRVTLEAEYAGGVWPLAWERPGYAYVGLGHDVPALENPPVREFLMRTIYRLIGGSHPHPSLPQGGGHVLEGRNSDHAEKMAITVPPLGEG